MRLRERLTALASRPHLPRRTVRLRLTLLYGGLFLASGAALLAITYLLVSSTTGGLSFVRQPGGGALVGSPSGSDSNRQVLQGAGLTPQQIQAQAAQLHAQATAQHHQELHQLLVNSAIALAGMLIVSIVLGWIVAGRVLRPLRTITQTARDISATNLDRRLALTGPHDELKELGDTVDALLARLDAAFRSQRQFVANASHELRTPLARQRTVGQVALRTPDATTESLRAVIERLLAAGRQQERLIDALLTLSRGQAGLDRHDPIDLAGVVDQIAQSSRDDAARRGLTLNTALAPANTLGDPRLIERLVANLTDNALRYNTDYGHIDLATSTHNGAAVLTVTNTGPVIPASALHRLRQPFQRLGQERTGHGDGLGLGLSIVDAITTAHDATLDLQPQPDGGLRITVTFPATHPSDTQRPSTTTTASRSTTPPRPSPAGPVPATAPPDDSLTLPTPTNAR